MLIVYDDFCYLAYSTNCNGIYDYMHYCIICYMLLACQPDRY